MGSVALRLGFESIESLPGGSNEVRKYRDPYLLCERVGKRVDLTMVDSKTLPEASTLQSISHANIVPIVTAAEVAGYDPSMKVIEIVTPFYPRGSITDALLRGHQFGGQEAITIIRSALLGLRELHVRHAICHRDVKSGNIFLTDPPIHAVIADIGVAGKLDGAGTVATANNPTLYSPPEFRTGVLTPASDLYSMGLIFRELLGGAFPYAEYSRQDVYDSLENGLNPLTEKDKQLPVWAPKAARVFYSKALSSNLSRRFRSAKDMSAALSKVKIADWRQESFGIWDVWRPQATIPYLRVEAQESDGVYRMSVKKAYANKWRRVRGVPDQEVPSLTSFEAQNFFTVANSLVVG